MQIFVKQLERGFGLAAQVRMPMFIICAQWFMCEAFHKLFLKLWLFLPTRVSVSANSVLRSTFVLLEYHVNSSGFTRKRSVDHKTGNLVPISRCTVKGFVSAFMLLDLDFESLPI